ncbi:STAS domain-containing protein [Geomonas sp. RF6]|uniref:STAS domain-containing protein n=1 Tax=Geomonas sp. RF6 TaxID=2897342 RepID=UPI001E55A950|nr:STAS domain-containing protein [Geomonas sp. RF6]UFS69758.1 STAS domain-containing protein [Geomonas sp. RF6]
MDATLDYLELANELKKYQSDILRLWITQLFQNSRTLVSMAGEENVKRMASQLLDDTVKALPGGSDVKSATYADVRKTVEAISGELAARDITPSETAMLIFSMKDAYLATLQNYYTDRERLTEVTIAVNRILDGIAVITFESFGHKREHVIKEQQNALLELSTPIVKIWDRILMIPLIGVLDSARTQTVMESLLTAIESTQSKVAILDISGIPIVDSLVAKHLIRTVSAAKLMGAQCIITGIRARISQTMIQLGVDLSDVITRATLADGLKVALDITGLKIVQR